MPKRGGRFYFEPPPGVLKQLPGQRRKSIVEKINDKPEEGNQSDVDFEEDLGEEMTDAEFLASLRNKKPMRRMKYNQNNEIERLLLHNGSGLSYHVNHNEFPSFNVGLWPNDNQDQLLVYPTCAFSIPRPIYISDTIQEKIDLCYRRPMAREYHRNRLFQTRTAYNTALKSK